MHHIPNPGYEIEIRGLLTPDDRQRLEARLRAEGASFEGEHVRESYIFPLDQEKLDLRVRETDEGPQLVLKRGRERLATIRWKHTLYLQKKVTLAETLKFVSHYGLEKGRFIRRSYATYDYRDQYKIVLATVPGAVNLDYFEIEAATDDFGAAIKFVPEIEKVARDLDLRFFSEDEYSKYLKELDKIDSEYTLTNGIFI